MDAALEEWHLEEGATQDEIDAAEGALGLSLPADYLAFMREHDGGDGFVGKNYLMLWGVSELEQFNREYRVNEFAPGLLLFGSSGGGEAYAFDTRKSGMPVVRVPFIPMGLRYVRDVARTFAEMLVHLASETDGPE